MPHLEDGLSMRKAGLIIKERVVELWGEEVNVTWGQETSLSLNFLIWKMGAMRSLSRDTGSAI